MTSNWKPTRGAVSVYFLLCAAGLLVAGISGLLGSKASLIRLALFGLAVIAAAGFCVLGLQTWKNPRLSTWWDKLASQQRLNPLAIIAAVIFLAGWLMVWTPLESFGKAYYYVLGVFPFVLWLTCASAAGLVLLLAARFGWNAPAVMAYFQNERPVFIFGSLTLVSFALIALAARFRVVGMRPEIEDFWYGAGAPVLAFQVLLALIVSLGLRAFLNHWAAPTPSHSQRVDLLLFILIWAVSAWLWASEPVRPDFLVAAPVAPNFEMYPDYDARNFDIMSQFALIGQGLNNNSFFDRTLYSAFLVYLHGLVGQDYQKVMALQAALYAIFPALLFLLGKHLHSRSAGLGLGILIMLRGLNQIQVGNLIETSHQKYMLTEFPTTILLAFATLLLVKWAQNPEKEWHLAGLAGGIIGLSTLFRPHPLGLLPLVIGLAILLYRRRARLWVGVASLIVVAALASLLPWLQFSGHNVSVFGLYRERIDTIIRERYPQFFGPQSKLPAPMTVIQQGSRHLAQISPAPTPEKSVLNFFIDNYLNNLVTSVQALPTTPYNLEPRVIVKKTENFWKPYWDGTITPWGRVLFPLNLILLALGLGAAWKRARLSGLIPLLIMLGYFAVNSLGRTSGGRYLVPVDWVVVVYYFLGLMALFELASSFFGQPQTLTPLIALAKTDSAGRRPWWAKVLLVLAISAALGSLIPLSQKLFPRKFEPLKDEALVSQFVARGGTRLGLSEQDLLNFLKDEKAFIAQGRSLYPRQFAKDEGLDLSVYNFYHTQPYPRTLFTLIGPKGENVILIPRVDPAPIANTAEAFVLGCRENGYVQAWAVVLSADNTILQRAVSTPLVCPLPKPTCDNNKNCR